MPDQAEMLRDRMEQRDDRSAVPTDVSHELGYAIALASSKGGVGKSHLTLNLGVALAQMGHSVCMLDISFSLGNLDLLCGQNGYWNLSHVISGTRSLSEILLRGPLGVQIIPGGGSLAETLLTGDLLPNDILRQFEQLEREHHFILLDVGYPTHPLVRQVLMGVDLGVIVTTPEPTSVADAYAVIKNLCHDPSAPPLELLVNQAETNSQAREIIERVQTTSRNFLHTEINSAGYVPRDSAVAEATFQRIPFRLGNPLCAASRAIEQLARRLCHLRQQVASHREPLLEPWGPGTQQRAA